MTFREMIEGLQILAKCDPRGLDQHLAGAEHDVIYASDAGDFEGAEDVDVEAYLEEHGEYPEFSDPRLSAEDNARLRELGWFIDPESETWKTYA